MVNRVHFPHSLSWFTVDRAHRATASLFSSPWALLRAWRRSRRACGGRGPRQEGSILPHFLHGQMRTPTVAIPDPSLSRKVVRILRNGRATAAPWPRHLWRGGRALRPSVLLSSHLQGAPCLAAWQGLQRVFPSLYRVVAGGTALPRPGSGPGACARGWRVQLAFPSAWWLGVAPFLTAVCARTCVMPRLTKRPCLGRLQYGGAMAGATDSRG
jgi:hypothetical protein